MQSNIKSKMVSPINMAPKKTSIPPKMVLGNGVPTSQNKSE